MEIGDAPVIQLPEQHRYTGYTVRPVRNTNVLTSTTGGARLPINRGGDHWALEVAPDVVDPRTGRELVADLIRAVGQTVRVALPQSGIEPGAIGSPVVAGASQYGLSLNCSGFRPYAAIGKGWWLTVVTGGRGRLHMIGAQSLADASGLATLSVWPALRAPANADVLHIVDPFIEGIVSEGGEHEAGLMRTISVKSFEVEELD